MSICYMRSLKETAYQLDRINFTAFVIENDVAVPIVISGVGKI